MGALVLLAALGASAWNIVGGYAGQVSVGHAVFFGFGAYSSVGVYTHLGWPPIAGAPLGIVLSVALASIIGVPTLRLSGHYFSMATIAVAELVRVLSSTSEFLGGAEYLKNAVAVSHSFAPQRPNIKLTARPRHPQPKRRPVSSENQLTRPGLCNVRVIF